MAVDHPRIRRLLGEQDSVADTSLRAKALERAQGGAPPRTLTPYEWEQWYATHGVPATHQLPPSPLPWWRRLLYTFSRDKTPGP